MHFACMQPGDEPCTCCHHHFWATAMAAHVLLPLPCSHLSPRVNWHSPVHIRHARHALARSQATGLVELPYLAGQALLMVSIV